MTMFNPDAPPTSRELEALRLLWIGCTYREASAYMNISRRTVDHHVQSIYKKLDVHCMMDAFRKMGWIHVEWEGTEDE